MKRKDAIIAVVSLLLLVGLGVVVLISIGGEEKWETMKGPVAIVTPGNPPSTEAIDNPAEPPPAAALGAQISGDKEGVLVQAVLPNSTAEAAGLQKGDIILAIAETPTLTPQALLSVMREHKVGEEVTVRIRRGDGESDLKVKLMPRGEAIRNVPRRPTPATRPRNTKAQG